MIKKKWKKLHRERFSKRHIKYASKITINFINLEEKIKFVSVLKEVAHINNCSYTKAFSHILQEFINKKNQSE